MTPSTVQAIELHRAAQRDLILRLYKVERLGMGAIRTQLRAGRDVVESILMQAGVAMRSQTEVGRLTYYRRQQASPD